ncbi:MAG TPA: PAS domain-containing protein, partial [Hymenobacter sp.]
MFQFSSSYFLEESYTTLRLQLREARLQREHAESRVAELQSQLNDNQALVSLQRLSTQSPSPILRLTTTGELLYANPAAEHLVPLLAAQEASSLREQLLALANLACRIGLPQHQELCIAQQHYSLLATPEPEEAYTTFYLTDITDQRAAEQRWATQQDFYTTILEELPTGVVVFDEHHRYLLTNQAISSDKSTREWLIGKTNMEACAYRKRPIETALLREALFEQAVNERREITWEETITNSGGQRLLRRNFRPVFRADGSLRMVVSSGADITEQREAENNLAKQREFYESILNQLPTDIIVFDDQYRYLFVNPAAVKDNAVREWMIGKTNFEYFQHYNRPMEIAERRQSILQQVLTERQLVSFEETLPSSEGPRHMLRRLHPVFSADGSVRMVIAYGLDITERQQAAQKLVEQREFYESILNQLPTDIGVFDNEQRYLFVNPAGIKDEVLRKWIIGKTNFDYFAYRNRPVELAERRKAMFDQVIAEGRQITFEETLTSPEGPRHKLRIFHPVLAADGTVRMIIAYGLDITERYQAEQQLTEQRKFY